MAGSDCDVEPCRWAALFHDARLDVGAELVDLPPHEQVARGQELLRLLWEPLPCEASEPRIVLPQQSPAPEAQMRVKNTFIEMVASPCRRRLTRSQSDSAIPRLVDGTSKQQVLNLSDHPNCDQCRDNASDGQEQLSGDRDSIERTSSNSAPAGTQHRMRKHNVLDLDACIKPPCCHVPKPHVLSLTACLAYSWSQTSTEADFSDTSTDTPRGSIEDISSRDVLEASMIADIMPEDCVEMPGPQVAAVGWHTNPHPDASHCLGLGSARRPTKCPSEEPTTIGEAWSSPWQWTAPVDVLALQLPLADTSMGS